MDKFIGYIKKINLVSFILILSLFAATLSVYSLYLHSQNFKQQNNYKKADLVIFMQSSDPKAARSAVGRALVLKKNNAINHIEVVFGGDGTVPLAHADQALSDRLEEANAIGIVMSACDAGLKANNLTPNDLPGFVSVVPYGIIRTMDLVAQGYTVMQY